LRFLSFDLRRVVLGVAALSALGVAARAQTPGQTPPPAAEVSVRFSAVEEKTGRTPALGPDDIKVTEGGKARAVTGLRRLGDMPLSLVVAVDTSASQERVLDGTKLAADVFVRGIMRPGVDEVGVVTFTGEATLEQGLTNDLARVRAAVARIKFVPPAGYVGGGVVVGVPPGDLRLLGSTAIWDAVSVVATELLALEPREVRRALILITDGVDTSSRLKLAEAVRDALRAEAVVYAVGIGDEKKFDGVDEGDLRKLTERTGGRAFFPEKVNDLPAIFTQIQAELLAPYVVTFAAPDAKRDGTLRKVKLEVANPELRRRGVKLTYPESYVAK
jgi:VWFA-related protein